MKLYRKPNGVWFGRRGDAGKDAEIVEVQTDANSLAAFLNKLEPYVNDPADEYVEGRDEYTTVVERQDPPVETDERVAQTVDLDDAFQNAPLGQQLTLASIALENARSKIGRENAPKPAPQGYGGKVERAPIAADDDVFN